MPRRPLTREACRTLPRYKSSASAAQLVCGLHRLIVHGDSLRDAVEHTNAASGEVANYSLLTRSTLKRFKDALPEHLLLPENATEAALLGWLAEYETGRQARRVNGQRLLPRVTEALIAEWIQLRCAANLPPSRDDIIEHARRLVPAASGAAAQGPSESSMRGWYQGFRHRFPDVNAPQAHLSLLS